MNQLMIDQNILNVLGIAYKRGMYFDKEKNFKANRLKYVDLQGNEKEFYYSIETGEKLLPKHLWEIAEEVTKNGLKNLDV